MSNISTIFDRINTVLASTYGSRKRLNNAYDLEDNADHLKRSGYGVKVGGFSPVDIEFHLKSGEQTFTIVLINEVFTVENNVAATDTTVKTLLEDVNTGQLLFYDVDQLSIENNIQKIDLGSVSEVSFLRYEKKFVTIEFDIVVTISESL